jgi:hypothetical protein
MKAQKEKETSKEAAVKVSSGSHHYLSFIIIILFIIAGDMKSVLGSSLKDNQLTEVLDFLNVREVDDIEMIRSMTNATFEELMQGIKPEGRRTKVRNTLLSFRQGLLFIVFIGLFSFIFLSSFLIFFYFLLFSSIASTCHNFRYFSCVSLSLLFIYVSI